MSGLSILQAQPNGATPMNPDEIALVQGSWQKVVPIREPAAALFYQRLFELDPSLSKLFKGT